MGENHQKSRAGKQKGINMSVQAKSSAELEASAAAGITAKLAKHAAGLRYEDLPPPLVDIIKQCVMDTLGVSIGASSLDRKSVV